MDMDIDIRFVVVDHVVKRVTFVLIQTNIFSIHGDIIRNQGVQRYASTFTQAFPGIAGASTHRRYSGGDQAEPNDTLIA